MKTFCIITLALSTNLMAQTTDASKSADQTCSPEVIKKAMAKKGIMSEDFCFKMDDQDSFKINVSGKSFSLGAYAIQGSSTEIQGGLCGTRTKSKADLDLEAERTTSLGIINKRVDTFKLFLAALVKKVDEYNKQKGTKLAVGVGAVGVADGTRVVTEDFDNELLLVEPSSFSVKIVGDNLQTKDIGFTKKQGEFKDTVKKYYCDGEKKYSDDKEVLSAYKNTINPLRNAYLSFKRADNLKEAILNNKDLAQYTLNRSNTLAITSSPDDQGGIDSGRSMCNGYCSGRRGAQINIDIPNFTDFMSKQQKPTYVLVPHFSSPLTREYKYMHTTAWTTFLSDVQAYLNTAAGSSMVSFLDRLKAINHSTFHVAASKNSNAKSKEGYKVFVEIAKDASGAKKEAPSFTPKPSDYSKENVKDRHANTIAELKNGKTEGSLYKEEDKIFFQKYFQDRYQLSTQDVKNYREIINWARMIFWLKTEKVIKDKGKTIIVPTNREFDSLNPVRVLTNSNSEWVKAKTTIFLKQVKEDIYSLAPALEAAGEANYSIKQNMRNMTKVVPIKTTKTVNGTTIEETKSERQINHEDPTYQNHSTVYFIDKTENPREKKENNSMSLDQFLFASMHKQVNMVVDPTSFMDFKQAGIYRNLMITHALSKNDIYRESATKAPFSKFGYETNQIPDLDETVYEQLFDSKSDDDFRSWLSKYELKGSGASKHTLDGPLLQIITKEFWAIRLAVEDATGVQFGENSGIMVASQYNDSVFAESFKGERFENQNWATSGGITDTTIFSLLDYRDAVAARLNMYATKTWDPTIELNEKRDRVKNSLNLNAFKDGRDYGKVMYSPNLIKDSKAGDKFSTKGFAHLRGCGNGVLFDLDGKSTAFRNQSATYFAKGNSQDEYLGDGDYKADPSETDNFRGAMNKTYALGWKETVKLPPLSMISLKHVYAYLIKGIDGTGCSKCNCLQTGKLTGDSLVKILEAPSTIKLDYSHEYELLTKEQLKEMGYEWFTNSVSASGKGSNKIPVKIVDLQAKFNITANSKDYCMFTPLIPQNHDIGDGDGGTAEEEMEQQDEVETKPVCPILELLNANVDNVPVFPDVLSDIEVTDVVNKCEVVNNRKFPMSEADCKDPVKNNLCDQMDATTKAYFESKGICGKKVELTAASNCDILLCNVLGGNKLNSDKLKDHKAKCDTSK